MGEISYESISKKLGFRPFVDKFDVPCPGHEDDSYESPFSVLTLEESLFLFKWHESHKRITS